MLEAFQIQMFPLCDQETLARLERNNMEFNDLKAYGAAMRRWLAG